MRLRLLLFIAAVGLCIAQDEDRAVGVPQEEASSAATGAPKDVDAPQADAQPPSPPADPPPQPVGSEPIKPISTPTTQEGGGDHVQRADLEAQESMARAAWAMFWGAAIQVLIGSVALWFLYLTLKASRDAVTEAEKATKAAQDAARYSADGVAVTRQVADSQLRPWLSVDCRIKNGFRPSKPGSPDYVGFWLDLEASVHNYGSSPASQVSFRAAITGIADEDDQRKIMNDFCDEVGGDVPESADVVFPSTDATFIHPVFLAQETIDSKARDIGGSKRLMVAVYGCASYTSPHAEGVCQTRFMLIVGAASDSGNLATFNLADDMWHLRLLASTKAVYMTTT